MFTKSFHTHTTRCRHAEGEDREYVLEAVKSGMTVLGFSDHSPYVFEGDYYSGFRMRPEEAEGYFASIQALKQEFAGQIEIHTGFEAEYYPRFFPAYEKLLSRLPAEYLLLGQHFLFDEIEKIPSGRETDDEKLARAAEDAMAAGFIREYEDGPEHKAAIRGANFSGGQKQRLLIARALAGDPEILILDDSSSALDYRTDAELRKALRAHHSGATTVVIAQRVSSILSMDEIIVLHEGEMLGRGTHEELLASCPEYRDICRTQMSETVGEAG